ncbi:hypothetical protein DFJ74DRAFT_744345, partial [Hyaloraphidium curvatum]
ASVSTQFSTCSLQHGQRVCAAGAGLPARGRQRIGGARLRVLAGAARAGQGQRRAPALRRARRPRPPGAPVHLQNLPRGTLRHQRRGIRRHRRGRAARGHRPGRGAGGHSRGCNRAPGRRARPRRHLARRGRAARRGRGPPRPVPARARRPGRLRRRVEPSRAARADRRRRRPRRNLAVPARVEGAARRGPRGPAPVVPGAHRASRNGGLDPVRPGRHRPHAGDPGRAAAPRADAYGAAGGPLAGHAGHPRRAAAGQGAGSCPARTARVVRWLAGVQGRAGGRARRGQHAILARGGVPMAGRAPGRRHQDRVEHRDPDRGVHGGHRPCARNAQLQPVRGRRRRGHALLQPRLQAEKRCPERHRRHGGGRRHALHPQAPGGRGRQPGLGRPRVPDGNRNRAAQGQEHEDRAPVLVGSPELQDKGGRLEARSDGRRGRCFGTAGGRQMGARARLMA